MEPRSHHESPRSDSALVYNDGPIPVDTEPKNLPEVVPPGLVPSAHHRPQQHLGAYGSSLDISNTSSPPPGMTATYYGNRTYASGQRPSEVSPITTAYAGRNPWPSDQQKRDTKGTICGLRRRFFIFGLILTVIIIILCGILGAVASGSIKTGASSKQAGGGGAATSTTASAATVTVTGSSKVTSAPPTPKATKIPSEKGDVTWECPSSNGLNITAPGTKKVFRRDCNANYFAGEGSLGMTNTTIFNTEDCISECALHPSCVGVVFNTMPECWLKEFIGKRSTGDDQESALLWQD